MVILIAEDEINIRRSLHLLLSGPHDIILCEDGQAALVELEKTTVDLVITDFQMPNVSGLELIQRGKEISPSTSFLMMTAHGSIDHAVDALQAGADDYVTKPFNISEIEHRVRKVEELRSWKVRKSLHDTTSSLDKVWIGESPFAKEARDFIRKAALASAPVYLSGPRGSGKSFLARLIHEAGPQGIFPLISVDCTESDENRLEISFFGQERSGSASRALGALELCRGGTLLLEEVDALPLGLQSKLKQVLETKTFESKGGTRKIPFAARLISTSSEGVTAGKLREDLRQHLDTLSLSLRALSETREDLPLLISHFWKELNKELRRTTNVGPELVRALCEQDWPGNLRQVRNTLERIAVLADGSESELGLDCLPPDPHSPKKAPLPTGGLARALADYERRLILETWETFQRNPVLAARHLELSPEELKEKLLNYGISISAALSKAA